MKNTVTNDTDRVNGQLPMYEADDGTLSQQYIEWLINVAVKRMPGGNPRKSQSLLKRQTECEVNDGK